MSERIGLAEAIKRVRAELMDAREAGEDEELRFRLGEVTLEFAVELSREIGGEAAVKVWVVNAGVKGTKTSTATNTVTVTMSPEVQGEDGEWQEARIKDQVRDRPQAPGDRYKHDLQ